MLTCIQYFILYIGKKPAITWNTMTDKQVTDQIELILIMHNT
jgi:hypothetical protein